VASEVKRLEKQIADKTKQLAVLKSKLGNESFVRNAPAEVVEQQRATASELEGQIASMEANRSELAAS
jgi:valyl-tRNA synthetase